MVPGCTKFVYVSQRLRSSDRGRPAGRTPRRGRGNPGHTTVVPEIVSVGEVHASGHREVVQRGQGLRVHRPGRRLGRRLRPPLHHQDGRVPCPPGEPAGRVHRGPRPEGPAGRRGSPALTRHATSRGAVPGRGAAPQHVAVLYATGPVTVTRLPYVRYGHAFLAAAQGSS